MNNPLYFDKLFDGKNICLECSFTDTDVCIRCEQNQEYEITQATDKRNDLQQDNDNDSMRYQLTQSNDDKSFNATKRSISFE